MPYHEQALCDMSYCRPKSIVFYTINAYLMLISGNNTHITLSLMCQSYCYNSRQQLQSRDIYQCHKQTLLLTRVNQNELYMAYKLWGMI